jgi:hypothetical protein
MPRPALIAATDNAEATRAASLEAALRRRRAGAGANILTSPRGIPGPGAMGAPVGIPAVSRMGEAA